MEIGFQALTIEADSLVVGVGDPSSARNKELLWQGRRGVGSHE